MHAISASANSLRWLISAFDPARLRCRSASVSRFVLSRSCRTPFRAGPGSRPPFYPELLKELPKPCLFRYRQRFGQSIREGVIGILNRAEAIIYPHERTFPANVSACAARLRATGVQTSTLWAWCDDLALPDQHSLFIEVMDRFNCLHQIESISDPFLIKRLQDSLQGKTLFLADGHHRFAAGWTLVIYPKLAAGLVMARHAG